MCFIVVIFVIAVWLGDIHEIRAGKSSKAFGCGDTKKIEDARCFVIFHGKDFILNTLCLAGSLFINFCVFKNKSPQAFTKTCFKHF